LFFRTTIKSHDEEPLALSPILFADSGIVGIHEETFEITCAMQIFSYAVPLLLKKEKTTD
jgi:hypothetical protein